MYRVSLRIVNLAALFLICLTSFVSWGRCPSRRNNMIDVIQLFVLCIVSVGASSMLGCFCTSIGKLLLSPPSSDDASFEISLASTFWFLGTCTNSTSSNYRVRCLVSLRYFCILSSFASYFPLICSTTSFESLWINRFFTPSAFPSLNPVNMPLYSTSLLVAGNLS